MKLNWLHTIGKVEKLMVQLTINVCILMTLLITIFVGGQVFARYVLNKGIPWSEEVSVALMIWMGLYGGSILFYEKSNIYVEFVIKKFKGPRKVITCFYDLLGMTFGLILLITGYRLASWGVNSVAPASGIPRLYFYGSVPVSGLFISIFSLFHFLRDLVLPENDEYKEVTK